MAPSYSHTPASWGSKGIVSKRRDSFYRSGHSPDWIKSKNPDAPAVRREAEGAGERARDAPGHRSSF
jgi:ATP-dependent DNA ligase